MRRSWIFLLFAAGLWAASDKKIVINAIDQHNRWAFTDEALETYKAAGEGAKIVMARTAADLAREIVDADGEIGGFSKDVFAKAQKLKWVQTYSAGVEAYRWKEFLDSSVTLTNCRIVQGPNIADHAMALLLSMTRGLNTFYDEKAKEHFDREGRELFELQDMTAVVFGVGGIAT